VYASASLPVDVDNPQNLMAVRLKGQQLTVPHKGRTLYYAVTAMDRYGQESEPITMAGANANNHYKPLDFRQLIIGNKLKKHKSSKN
jgi:hypothetical protein